MTATRALFFVGAVRDRDAVIGVARGSGIWQPSGLLLSLAAMGRSYRCGFSLWERSVTATRGLFILGAARDRDAVIGVARGSGIWQPFGLLLSLATMGRSCTPIG